VKWFGKCLLGVTLQCSNVQRYLNEIILFQNNWLSSPKETIFPETIPEESSSTEEEHVVSRYIQFYYSSRGGDSCLLRCVSSSVEVLWHFRGMYMPASSILGMPFNPEDGDNTFPKTLMNFYRTTWLHILENCTAPVVSSLNPCKVLLSLDSAVGVATGYGLNDRGCRGSRFGRVKNFHFCMLSLLALGPTHPPVQWVLGTLFLGRKVPKAWS
jgi:hypothetical protein